MKLLSYVTLILSIAIFISILFGCTYKKRFEGFESDKSDKSKKPDTVLSENEKSLLEGLQNGSIDEKKLEKFISEEKVDKKSVEKIINHIQEKFENEVKDKKST